MESSPTLEGPGDARSALSVADSAGRRFAAGLRLPTGLYPALAAAVALQIGTAAVGTAEQSAAGLAVLLAGSAVFLLVAALELHRFRRVNGVRVDGLSSKVVLATGAISTLSYLGALVVSTWSAFASVWWLVAVASLAGGGGYALGVRQWWRAYRDDPVAHAGGASPRLLAALAVLACLGLLALLVAG